MTLAEFASWCIRTGPFDAWDLDGADVQAKAEECGLIVPVAFDPAKHRDIAGTGVKTGDPWFEFSDEFKAALAAERK